MGRGGGGVVGAGEGWVVGAGAGQQGPIQIGGLSLWDFKREHLR